MSIDAISSCDVSSQIMLAVSLTYCFREELSVFCFTIPQAEKKFSRPGEGSHEFSLFAALFSIKDTRRAKRERRAALPLCPARILARFLNMHGHATIDADNLAGDVASLWRAEESDRRSHLFRGTEAAQGRDIEHCLLLLLRQGGGEFGWDEARSHNIRRDIAAGHFARGTQGQANQARLRGAVVSLAGVAQQAGDGGDVHDPAPACAHHPAQRGPGAEKGRMQIGLQDRGKIGQSHLQDQLIARGACIIDENADRTELLIDLCEKAVDLLFLAHIGLHRDAASAQRLDAGLCFGSRVCVTAIVDHDICASRGQALGCGASNPLAAPGDERDFPCQWCRVFCHEKMNSLRVVSCPSPRQYSIASCEKLCNYTTKLPTLFGALKRECLSILLTFWDG